MILQNTVCYADTRPAIGLWGTIITRIHAFLSTTAPMKENDDQKVLYRDLAKLSQKQLGDIGFSDPQVQIRSFGRYLDNGMADRRDHMDWGGGLAVTKWHY